MNVKNFVHGIFLLILLQSSLCITGFAQKPIGNWTIHAGYVYPQQLVQIDDYIISNGIVGLYFVNPSNNDQFVVDKSNGLSETDISKIAYLESLKKLVVVYQNANIDIIDFNNGRTVYNLPDIKQKIIIGDKKVYGISFFNNLCYLSTGFGIVVFDIEKRIVKETYKIGKSGENWRVNNVVFFNNNIVAATEKGIRSAALNNKNLQDFSNWNDNFNDAGFINKNIRGVYGYQNTLFALTSDSVYKWDGTKWSLFYGDTNFSIKNLVLYKNNLTINAILDSNKGTEYGFKFLVIQPDFSMVEMFKDVVRYPNDILVTSDNKTFIGGLGGIIEVENNAPKNKLFYPGPGRDFYQFKYLPKINTTYVSTGSLLPSYKASGYYVYDGFSWSSKFYDNPAYDGLKDIMAVVQANNKLYIANNIGGLAEVDNLDIKVFNTKNSILENYYGDSSVRLVDLAVDKDENLWMLNYFCPNPIKVLTKKGEWFKFNPLNENKAQVKIIIDKNNNKWIMFKGDGLMVFNEGKDLTNESDDKAIRLNVTKDKCEVSNVILDIVEDKEGSIWCGTEKGVQIFNCGSNPFAGNCKSFAPVLKKGDGSIDPNDTFVECLLSYEVVNAIAVDGGNRKWCGTNNGVFLISADGKSQLEHFTTENSPLLSNQILDIFVDPKNGDVMMGTSKGIVSYRGTATEGSAEQSNNIQVYPNPVPKDYFGQVTIDNLVDNATIKITDISGKLVYEAKAQGGRVVWNGLMYNGQKPHSGVYMIFIANEFAEQTGTARIVFQR